MSDEVEDIGFAVLTTEFCFIFIIKTFTVVAFARSRRLRKRSTYLVKNQTVADMLVGAVAGPVYQNGLPGPQLGLSWINCWRAIIDSFYIVSVGNLALISLERLHATLNPFNHCLVGKRVYCKIIFCSWFGSFILASVFVILEINEPVACRGAWVSYTFVTLSLLTAAYVIISSKALSKPYAQRFSSVILGERKLSITLLIVTAASIATLLPWAITSCISLRLGYMRMQLAFTIVTTLILAIYYLNSILNPLIYAIKWRQFRRALKGLFCKNTSSTGRALPIDLLEMYWAVNTTKKDPRVRGLFEAKF